MFDRTPSIYNNEKVTHDSGNIRLQINGLDELRKFDITYLAGLDIILRLP